MRLESIAELAHTFCSISANSSLSWYPFIYLGTDNVKKNFLCKERTRQMQITGAGFVKPSKGDLYCLSNSTLGLQCYIFNKLSI